MTVKKLYKIIIMKYVPEMVPFKGDLKSITTPSITFEFSRNVEVAAIDASQAIRKVKYNLTKRGDPIRDDEFIDEVTRLGTIEVK